MVGISAWVEGEKRRVVDVATEGNFPMEGILVQRVVDMPARGERPTKGEIELGSILVSNN